MGISKLLGEFDAFLNPCLRIRNLRGGFVCRDAGEAVHAVGIEHCAVRRGIATEETVPIPELTQLEEALTVLNVSVDRLVGASQRFN